MKKVPQSWKASFYPMCFGNHSLTCFSKSTLMFSLRENGLWWQLDVSQPFVYLWLQSRQEGKQIYFLNIVWCAEYTNYFLLQNECQIYLPREQCRGVCWNSDLGKEKQADGENKRILMSWSATVHGVTKSQTWLSKNNNSNCINRRVLEVDAKLVNQLSFHKHI